MPEYSADKAPYYVVNSGRTLLCDKAIKRHEIYAHTYIELGDLYIIIYAASWYRMTRKASIKNWRNWSVDPYFGETAETLLVPFTTHTAENNK